jgi:mono/diheme cytochrome c family protein
LIIPHPLLRVVLVSSVMAASVPLTAPAQAPAQTPAPAEAEGPRDPPPPLPADILKDAKVVAEGESLWKDTCAHCHGSKAYPGKAPKLQPHRYKPEFVWDRVHNGFRAMPPWKEAYTPEQVVAVVAYVLSDEFWP